MACTGTALRVLVEVMDAFGVRVRIGAELFLAVFKALFRHWNLMFSLYSGGAPPNALYKCQQSTSEELQFQPDLSDSSFVELVLPERVRSERTG
jgi:hypothetical protein